MKIIIIPNSPVMAARHFSLANTLIKQGNEVHYLLWELPYNVKATELVRHLGTSLIPKEYKNKKIYDRLTSFRVLSSEDADVVRTEHNITADMVMEKGLKMFDEMRSEMGQPKTPE